MSKKLKIGITHGDINGISYEIVIKALNNPMLLELCTPVIYGSPKVLAFYKKMFDLSNVHVITISSPEEAQAGKAYIINCCPEDIKVETGKQSSEAGALALAALDMASADLTAGKLDALATAPINKSTIQSDKFHFPGHTEYLEKIAGNQSIMMLTSDNVRVALVTNHTPIHLVSSKISQELIVSKLKMLHQSLLQDFCITCPRIAVLGLNPHSSDNGLLGEEEDKIIKPAIDEANALGITCTGPLSADGFWGAGTFAKYDAILAMYHDQGLSPFKALFQDTGVNFTAGLDFVRTSPAHGTAYDLAGKNLASCHSLLKAIYLAIDVVKNRRLHADISQNPLKVERVNEKREVSE